MVTGCTPMHPEQLSAQQVDELKTKLGFIGVIGAPNMPKSGDKRLPLMRTSRCKMKTGNRLVDRFPVWFLLRL